MPARRPPSEPVQHVPSPAARRAGPQKVSDNDRLSFAIFISAAIQLTFVFGLGLDPIDRYSASHSLEVVLAQSESDKEPEDADFIAQSNQEGSGTLEEKAIMSTDQEAEFSDNVIRDVQTKESVPQTVDPQTVEEQVTTSGVSPFKVSSVEFEVDNPTPQLSEDVSLVESSLEIASLEAALKEKRQNYAKRPRVRQVTTVSTKEARDALYLDEWRKKIERVGEDKYPPEASRRKLYGQLKLLVAIKADGSIREVKILKSSGHRILDDAAIRIVRHAAPFAPFPEEIRKDTDVLEIIRTWYFESGQVSSR